MELKEYARAITDQFVEKNWIDELKREKASKLISVGDRLTDTGRNMIVDLMEKFLIVESPQYRDGILKSLSTIPCTTWEGIDTVYILPLLAPEDKNKSKSGNAVYYIFKEEIIKKYFRKFNIKMVYCNKGIDEVPNDINQLLSRKIILVDDFVGTGDTAVRCINGFSSKEIDNNKIKIISIASMLAGKKMLEERGVDLYAGILLNKGISSLKNKNVRESYQIEMIKLEEESAVEEDRRFGYGQSEALISLIRTPNNVFPIFWYSKSPYAIFQR